VTPPVPPPLGARAGRLLGTALFELDASGDSDVLLVSDLHLRPEADAATAAFERLLDAVPDGGLALILGDLFDYWVGRTQLQVAAWRRVPEALRRAAERSVRIYVLHGNRDYQLGRAFERATGARVVAGGLIVRARRSRDLVCLHGDELCLNDEKYQQSKRYLRCLALRALGHTLPFSWSRRFADRARSISKRSVSQADPYSLRPSERALRAVAGLGDVDLMFGHIHLASYGALTATRGGLAFRVLPAFEVDTCGHAIWSPGALPTYVAHGRAMDWPVRCRLGR